MSPPTDGGDVHQSTEGPDRHIVGVHRRQHHSPLHERRSLAKAWRAGVHLELFELVRMNVIETRTVPQVGVHHHTITVGIHLARFLRTLFCGHASSLSCSRGSRTAMETTRR